MQITEIDKNPNKLRALDKIDRAESTIVGILLQWPEMVLQVPFDMEIFVKYRPVVAEIIKQVNSGITPNLLTVTDTLPKTLPDIPSVFTDLGQLARDTASNANYKYYIEQLTELRCDVSVYNQLRDSLKQIAEGTPTREVFGKIVNETLLRLSGNVPKFAWDAKEMVTNALDKLERDYENKGNLEGKVRSGIAKLDEVLGSFMPSNLIVVGARPAVGKTAAAVSMMINMSQDGKKVGFISSEMSVNEITQRLLSQLSGVYSGNLRRGELSDKEWKMVADASGILAKLQLRVCDKPTPKMSEVIMQCRAWDMTDKLDVVIIDYLTRIRPDKQQGNQNLDVGDLITAMKNLARTMDIPVIVLAQLNRDSVKRADKTPNMADLRDSGIIEQEADCILLLHRDEQDGAENNYIIIEKNRHGEAGVDLLVNFDKKTMCWY